MKNRHRIDNGTRTFEFKDVAINGFNIYCHLVGNANGDNPTNVDLEDVRFKAVLHQNGEKYDIIPSTSLKPLYWDSILNSPVYLVNLSWMNGLPSPVSTKSASVSQKGEALLSVPLRFSGGIILKGSDKITVEVTVGSSAYPSNSNNDSYYTVEPSEAVVNQTNIPYLIAQRIPANSDRFTENFGDNVHTMSLIGTGSDFVKPVKDIEVDTDKLDYKLTFDELKQLSKFEEKTQKHSSCVLLSAKGYDFDDVRVEMDLNLTELSSNPYYIVRRAYDLDREVLHRAQMRHARHQSRKMAKLKNA